MPPVVSLQGIRFVRNKNLILDGIDWSIEPGQHWAMLGANGSGKTTLLKVITGMEWPSEGTVDLLGERLGQTDIRELRKRVGWASSALIQRMKEEDTARSIVVSGLEASIGLWREFSEAEWQRADEALAMMEATSITERPWQHLSQGERQRTLIARALVNRPPLLILDEPCAGLDPTARQHFLDDMGRLAKRSDSPTIILVTHHIEEIADWIDHVLVIRDGKVLAISTPDQALTSAILSEAFGSRLRVVEIEGTRTLLSS